MPLLLRSKRGFVTIPLKRLNTILQVSNSDTITVLMPLKLATYLIANNVRFTEARTQFYRLNRS